MRQATRMKSTRRIGLILAGLIAIAGLLVPAVAPAVAFTATARIFCPAQVDPTTGHIDSTFGLPTTLVPCAGIRVLVMDADPLWDEVCGVGFTDSAGRVTIQSECGDGVDPPPEVFLKVQARSVNGFSVGTVKVDVVEDILEELAKQLSGPVAPVGRLVDHFDDLRDHQTFEWVSPPMAAPAPMGVAAFGSQIIGGGSATSLMAARQFWVAQFTMNRLLAGTRFRPMDFNYSLNAPIGFPTTLYDTVVVDFTRNTGRPATRALRASAHEIGHVLYNTYHSDIRHFLDDAVPDYMTQHARCDTDHPQTLAWYEGFADFVRDYVFQRWDWNAWSWALGFAPAAGCAFDDAARPRSTSVEGNVQGLLNDIFFGPVRAALDATIRAPAPTSFTCPPGSVLVDAGASGGSMPECESESAVACTVGSLRVDSRDFVDECISFVQDPGCVPCRDGARNCMPECERVEQRVSAGCLGGRSMRRAGPDACLVRNAALPVPGGPPVVPVFGCRPGQTLIAPPPGPFGGPSQCEFTVPIDCTRGRLVLDRNGLVDHCEMLVESAACQRERQRLADSGGSTTNFRCENIEEISLPAGCETGTATRRVGRDNCFARVPAVHALPNGNPRERPDGSPDAVLGFDRDSALAWFGLPSLDDVMDWINDAGKRAHRANEFWPDFIRRWCVGRDGLRDRYCNPNRSSSFRDELTRLDGRLQ